MRMSVASPERLHHYTNILSGHLPSDMRERIACPTWHHQAPPKAAVIPTQLTVDELRSGLERLPTELRLQIEENFIQSCVGQDFIFPDQKPGINGFHEFQGELFEPMRYETFLCLNKANYHWHSPQFWDSYFVVGPGPASDSMQWLQRMAKSVRNRVQKVYISLDIIDYNFDEMRAAEYRSWITPRDDVDVLGLFDKYDRETASHNIRLRDIWRCKLKTLTELKLKSLVIDLRNARGVDGSYMASRVWLYMPRFGKNKPEEIKILADRDELASFYMEAFNMRNP